MINKQIKNDKENEKMIHPSYNELLKTLNEVRDENEPEIDSRYSLVIASAKRARQIVNGQDMLGQHIYSGRG